MRRLETLTQVWIPKHHRFKVSSKRPHLHRTVTFKGMLYNKKANWNLLLVFAPHKKLKLWTKMETLSKLSRCWTLEHKPTLQKWSWSTWLKRISNASHYESGRWKEEKRIFSDNRYHGCLAHWCRCYEDPLSVHRNQTTFSFFFTTTFSSAKTISSES